MFSATLTFYHLAIVDLAILMVIGEVTCYSDGAPPASCYSLLPSHLQPGTHTMIPPIPCSTDGQCSGLRITVTRNGFTDGFYSCGSDHQVTLESTRDFVGYLIQARVPLAGQPFHQYRIVGTMLSAGPFGRLLQCNSTADSPSTPPWPNTATQNITTPVRRITVTWRAPEPFIAQGNIQFYAAIVEDFDRYYLPVTSEELEPLNYTCESYLPFLSLGTTAEVMTQEIAHLDDWSSDPIPVPGGFPFATYNHTVVYIGTNGVFSFGYREAGYWSHISDSTRFYAAPFWGDLNIEDGGDIFYEIHSAPSLLIDQVSSLISLCEGVPFSGTWMVVAYWKNTQQFGFPNGSGNTFQGIVLTNGKKSFMVSTFRNQSISWYNSNVRIGYLADKTHFSFGPLDNPTFLSLLDIGSVMYYNEIYQLSIDDARLIPVQPVLNNVSIYLRPTSTIIQLQFDLAVDATSCDTSEFLLQTLNGAVTFVPNYRVECEPVVDYFYSEASAGNIITFILHPRDHIRLLGKLFNQIIAMNNSVTISIGSTFVYTMGNSTITPIYFTDMFKSSVQIQAGNVTVLAFSLDMITAEFTMELSAPANVSSLSSISLSCGVGSPESAAIRGTLSTPEANQITQIITLRISPFHFVDICRKLTCIKEGYVVLLNFTSFQDILGNSVSSDQYKNTNISVIGAHSCELGVDGQDPADKNYTHSEFILLGPLRLYVELTLNLHEDVPLTVLYPLLADEVYLPDCHEGDVTVVSVVCLRFNTVDSAPQLTVTGPVEDTIAWSNTVFSATANFQTVLPEGIFSCSSTEGHVFTARTAMGETFYSTGGQTTSISVTLGSYWQIILTIAMCPYLNPWDVIITNDRDSPLVGLSVSNSYQVFSTQAGPLYLDDASGVNVLIPTMQSHDIYHSVFNITIKVPAVQVYTAGSNRGIVVVALARLSGFVDASLFCIPENEYVSVIWFVYQSMSLLELESQNGSYIVERNGQNLMVQDVPLMDFLSTLFECRLMSSSSGMSVPIVNFTTVAIPDPITISTEKYQRSTGLVSGIFKHNTIFATAALATNLILPCYGASGYGGIRWQSTVFGYLSNDSTSPYYSVQYNGSVATLTVYSYADPKGIICGSFTCYSEEVGMADKASVTVHITNDVCLCDTISQSPYPISLCPGSSSNHCICPMGYVGDGVLCAVDGDGDGYTDVDMSLFHYCQTQTENILCTQDNCPHVYNPNQTPALLDGRYMNAVAFEMDGVILPPSVVIATTNTSLLNTIRCLGTQENITVELFDFNGISQDLVTEICITEAKIQLHIDNTFEGALKCQSGATGQTAWMYFSRDACMCITESVSETVLPNYVRTCTSAGIEACECTNMECECGCWQSGDGRVCSVDSDGDGYPDQAPSPLCAVKHSPSYCNVDTCPVVYDPSNDPRACEKVDDAESVCESETDSSWQITWTETHAGYYATQSCPRSSGYAVRQCEDNGVWSQVVDTLCCTDSVFDTITGKFKMIFEGDVTNGTKLQLATALTDLVEATTPPDDRSSLYPQDLETTNSILMETIDFLSTGVKNNFLDEFNREVVQVIDNVLEENNFDGWKQLIDKKEGAELLLDNAEMYGSYIAEAIASPDVEVDLVNGELILNASFDNIYISARVQESENTSDITFPVAEEDFSLEPVFGQSLAHIRIPVSLLEKRASESDSSKIFAVNMVIENINELLFVNEEVIAVNGTNYTTRAVTQLLVSQVMVDNGTNVTSSTHGIPIQLVFVTEEIKYHSKNPRCVYFDFNKSEWLDTGVTTDNVTVATDGHSYHLLCTAEHFTSFAVLVDVSDIEINIPSTEAFALTLLTYIGCGISLVCLALSILFYLSYSKALFTSVHYFVHLNLAMALFLGYAVFLIGTYYGTQHHVACGVVAGLLHYLFLSVFCWMLCEGIMLYLMLVIVFSKLSKKWWLFLIIGWGLPVIVVGIAVSVQYEDYGDPDRGFCWISVDHGLIWAFVGPMLAIIAVNIFFLCATLRSLYHVTAAKFKDKKPLIKKMVMAAIILLPLLGVTWAVGLLAVNRNTTVFTWLFTLFNSLQGLFFFLFHVIRSDKVWNAIMRCLRGEGKDKHSRSPTRTTQTSLTKRLSSLIETLRREPEKAGHTKSELSSETAAVLGNALTYEHGNKKDELEALEKSSNPNM